MRRREIAKRRRALRVARPFPDEGRAQAIALLLGERVVEVVVRMIEIAHRLDIAERPIATRNGALVWTAY